MPEAAQVVTQETINVPGVYGTTPAAPAESDPPAQKPTTGEAPVEKEGEQPQQQQATDEHPEKRGKNRFERRLDRAYRREAEARARADLLERQYQELQAKVSGPTAIEGQPKLEQFDDIEKYAQAVAEFRSKKAVEEHEAKQRQQQSKASQAQLSSRWEEAAERGSGKYDDWDDVVGEIKPTNAITVAIMRATNGDDVAYHLGKNMKEATRIAGLEPIEQILAIGELSAKLRATPPVAKQPSKAPPPINPVSATATQVAGEELTDDDDMKTFIKKRNRQLGRKVK